MAAPPMPMAVRPTPIYWPSSPILPSMSTLLAAVSEAFLVDAAKGAARGPQPVASVRRVQRILQVNAGQDGEHIGLDEGHQQFKGKHADHSDDRDRRDCGDGRKAREDLDDGVACDHVA